ncbi:MAG TPA: hypothetical protein VIX14_13705 [Terriglobales bacterium]
MDPAGRLYLTDDVIFLVAGGISGVAAQATSDLLTDKPFNPWVYIDQAFIGAYTGWVVGNCVESIVCAASFGAAAGSLFATSTVSGIRGEAVTPCQAIRSLAYGGLLGSSCPFLAAT